MRISDINYPSQTTKSALVYHCRAVNIILEHASHSFCIRVPRCPYEKSLDILPLDYTISCCICCYRLPQNPQQEGGHTQPRPEPLVRKVHHRWNPKLQLAWSSCRILNVIWAIWQNFGSFSQSTTFGCRSPEWLKPQWREITPEPKNIYYKLS